MQQALIGGDLGIHADPKAHVRLEFRRRGEGVGRLGAQRRAMDQGSENKRQRDEPSRPAGRNH